MALRKQPVDWSLSEIWNAVAFKPQKELVPRDYIYASELGAPMYDRFLKMKGVKMTNPPNQRSLRKFLAGNLFEYVVKSILVTAGIYKHDEVKVDAKPYPDCIDVHGRCDFQTVSGLMDVDQGLAHLELIALPEYLREIGKKLIESLHGVSLKPKILELKSVSSFAMDKIERMQAPMPNHTLQAYHYQKNGGIEASICYCCRDDCRMAQFGIDAKVAEPLYRLDIEEMTHYWKKKKEPPKAPLCIFDETLVRFSKNLGVEYSPYLSHYGFKDPDEFREAVKYVDSWNRVIARYANVINGATSPTGKPIQITPKNIAVRKEIEAAGHDFERIIQLKAEAKEVEQEEE